MMRVKKEVVVVMIVKKEIVVVMLVKKKVVVVMLVTNPSIGRSRIAIENNQHLENIIYNQLLENILYNQQLKNDFHFFIFCEKKTDSPLTLFRH